MWFLNGALYAKTNGDSVTQLRFVIPGERDGVDPFALLSRNAVCRHMIFKGRIRAYPDRNARGIMLYSTVPAGLAKRKRATGHIQVRSGEKMSEFSHSPSHIHPLDSSSISRLSWNLREIARLKLLVLCLVRRPLRNLASATKCQLD